VDITELEWAYLAGVIDGEGCIRIQREKRKRASSNMSLIVTNGDVSLVRWLRDKFEGKAHLKSSSRPCWNVWWTAAKACYILENVYPFLIVKQKQARCALDFQSLLRDTHRRGRQPVLTEANLAQRDALIEAISILKHSTEKV